MFLFNLSLAAQPGDEATWYEKTVARLKTLDEEMVRQPNDADLYFQQGSLYLDLFRLHPEVAQYHGVVYVTDPGGKALAALNRAIQLDQSQSEYYVARGRYYDFQWGHALSRGSDAAASSWEKVRQLFWDNRSFDSAVKDYQKALSVSRNRSEMSRPLDRLAWMYRTRATSASFYAPAKTVRTEKQTRLVFDDFDQSLEFARKYLDASANPSFSTILIRDIYFDKSRAAIEFEEYANAVKTLTEAIREIRDRWQAATEGVCSLYILRGDVNQKLKDYDAAVRDYTYPIEQKYPNCDLIHSKRGDAYSAKGEWQSAIEDYSRELETVSYIDVSLLTRRAKGYLKIGDAENAIDDLNRAMTFHKSCSEQYQLRAEAFRMLKDDIRAAEDEKTADSLSRNKIGCSL
jgi:tetratricopeptide (TPR) repeat protein